MCKVMEEASPEQTDLIDAKLVCLYQSEDGLVVPYEHPVMFLLACSLCAAPCTDAPCSSCGWSYCSRCGPCRCLAANPGDFEDSPRGPLSPRDPSTEPSADTGTRAGRKKGWGNRTPIHIRDLCIAPGSTEELVIEPNLYEKLRDPYFRSIPIALESGFLVQLPLPQLSRCLIEDELAMRAFGTCHDDFKRLSRNLAWDLPGGLLVVNLDRKRTLLFSKEYLYELQVRDIRAALQWMRRGVGTFGLCVKSRQGGCIECVVFGVVNFMELAEEYLEMRKHCVMREVCSWR